MSKVPTWLVKHVGALLILCGVGAGGVGVGTVFTNDAATQQAQQNEYVQAVASDPDTSMAVKLAMVLGSYYESSGKHIGTPYIDRVGRGQPLTVPLFQRGFSRQEPSRSPALALRRRVLVLRLASPLLWMKSIKVALAKSS